VVAPLIDLVRLVAEHLADVALEAPPVLELSPAERRRTLADELEARLRQELGPVTDPVWARASIDMILRHLVDAHARTCGVCERLIRGHGGRG